MGKAAKCLDIDGVQLTAKEFAFCYYFLQHLNRSKAVVDAGYCTKGKKARVVAYELLKRDRIRKYLSIQLKAGLIMEKASAIADAILTSDLGKIYVNSGNSFDIKEIYNAGLSHLIRRYKTKKITRTDKDGNITETIEIEIEREDKLRAAEVLSKLQGWFNKNVNNNLNAVPASQMVKDRIKKLKEEGKLKGS